MINTIINGKCEDIFPKITKKHKVSLVVTDPPYNIGFDRYEDYKENGYKDNLTDEEYIELLSTFKGQPSAVIHYPEEMMKYVVPAMGVPNEVLAWCYPSNIGRKFRLINIYGKEPDFKKVLQPYKNLKDKRIQQQMANGSMGTPLYDWFSDINIVKNVSKEKTIHPCFIAKTKIYTLKGIEYIKNVKKGDKVLTHTGEFKKVLNTLITFDQELIKIISIGPENVICTPTHPFLVKREGNIFWEEAQNLKKTDFLVFPNKDCTKKYNSIDFNYYKWSKKITESLKITKDLCSLIGYFLSEGWVSRYKLEERIGKKEPKEVRFAFHIKEQKYIEEVLSLTKKIFGIEGEVREEKDKNTTKIFFSSKRMAGFFRLFGKGAANKNIPKEIFFSNTDYLKELIRTYWNGDGTVSRKNKRYQGFIFDTISWKLAHQIGWILNRMNIYNSVNSRLRKEKNKKKNYSVSVSGGKAKELNKILKTKYNFSNKNYIKSDENYIYYPFLKIEKIKNNTVYNIEVEKDKSYIANGYTVHNCPVPIKLIERLILLLTEEHDIVVDPFMGSGTTAIACRRTNRKFIGIEMSKKYCDLATKRIDKYDENNIDIFATEE